MRSAVSAAQWRAKEDPMFEHIDELELEASERGVTLAELLCYRPTLEVARLYAELLEGGSDSPGPVQGGGRGGETNAHPVPLLPRN